MYVKKRNNIFLLILVCLSSFNYSQIPKQLTSGEIYQNLEKLNFLGSVLYVAAHPDDENTRLIAYLANSVKANTTYLSLTRGDGGQNLIGSEVGPLLGAIRTQELLMARSIDNGFQMFTRANDFGYSKNAEETIRIWDAEKVKADVVWAIRNVRPDVIINRFDHRTSGETHGHHTASAQLSYELFEKSIDPTIYPEQLLYAKPWSARRLFFNTSWWFYGSEEKFKKADKSKLMSMDVGVYYNQLGKSNTEIAAESRSRHKCQGFGSTGTRGSQIEYLELLKGDLPPNKSDIFEGINTTWSRIPGANDITKMVEKIIQGYNFRAPHHSIPSLVKLYSRVEKISDEHWKKIKITEITRLIEACAGLYLETKANAHRLTSGELCTIDAEIINRSAFPITLKSVKGVGINFDTMFNLKLVENESTKWTKNTKIPSETKTTAPYWLTMKGDLGLYRVEDQELMGKPMNERVLKSIFIITIDGKDIPFEKDIKYKFNSPENGETYRPLEIVPAITVNTSEPVYIFSGTVPREVALTITSWAGNQQGSCTLSLPDHWQCEPKTAPFKITQKGESQRVVFSVKPPESAETITVSPSANVEETLYTNSLISIPYEHIPYQTIVSPSQLKLVNLEIGIQHNKVAYIAGAGDEIPAMLKQIGYDVTTIKPSEITRDLLAQYQALVIGVRAYNTEEPLKFKQKEILSYVENGGHVVVQYNTANGLVTKDLGPYPFAISRNRVTVEEAEMRLINSTHPVLNTPNKITSNDFKNWVQERGLYFPVEWDSKYSTIISCNDPNEPANDGSILIADYGKGSYIYTSLSFFRELPAGVSGAFRLFANLISYSRTNEKP